MTCRAVSARIIIFLVGVMTSLGVVFDAATCQATEAISQTVTIFAQESQGRISNRLMGINVVYGAEKDAYWQNPAMIKAVKQLVGQGFVRYPGGEITSAWHWQQPTGQLYAGKEDTWDPKFDGEIHPPSQWMSLGEYFQFIKESNATALIGINVESGVKYHREADTAKQTTDLVRHLLDNHQPVQWYFIDNESYMAHTHQHLTATQYAQVIHRAAANIRRVQPNAKIIINWTAQWSKGWNTIMKIAGDDFDFVDMHAYWNWGNPTFAAWLKQPHIAQNEKRGRTYRQVIEKMRKHLRAHGSHAGIGILEWNIGGGRKGEKGGRNRASAFQTALIDSEIMMQFIDAKLDAACFWPLHVPRGRFMQQSLIDVGALEKGEVRVTPIYQALNFFTALEGHTQLKVTTPGSKTQAVAAIDPQSRKLFLCILRKDAQPAQIHLNLQPQIYGKPAAGKIDIRTLHAAGDNTRVEKAQISTARYRVDHSTGQVIFSIPGFSLTQVVLSP